MMTGLLVGGAVFALVGLITMMISAILDSENGFITGFTIICIISVYVIVLALISIL